MTVNDEIGDGGLSGEQDRRDALKKIGIGAAGAAALWSAPSVLSVSVAAAASGGVAGCVGCGLENIVNGSFETNPPAGGQAPAPPEWNPQGPAYVLPYAGSGLTPPPGAGVQTGLLLDFNGSLSQTFNVDASCRGRAYVFSFWAWSPYAGNARLSFPGSSAADVNVAIPALGGLSYSQYSSSPGTTIPPDATQVTVTFTTDKQIGVDLVSFVIGC